MQLQARLLERDLRGGDVLLAHAPLGRDLVELRARDAAVAHQRRVASLLLAREVELRAQAGQVRFGLALAQPQRRRVEAREHVAGLQGGAHLGDEVDASADLGGDARVLATGDAARRPVQRRERDVDRGRDFDVRGRRLHRDRRGSGRRLGVPEQGEGDDGPADGDGSGEDEATESRHGDSPEKVQASSAPAGAGDARRARHDDRKPALNCISAGTSTTVNTRLSATPPTVTAASPR